MWVLCSACFDCQSPKARVCWHTGLGFRPSRILSQSLLQGGHNLQTLRFFEQEFAGRLFKPALRFPVITRRNFHQIPGVCRLDGALESNKRGTDFNCGRLWKMKVNPKTLTRQTLHGLIVGVRMMSLTLYIINVRHWVSVASFVIIFNRNTRHGLCLPRNLPQLYSS